MNPDEQLLKDWDERFERATGERSPLKRIPAPYERFFESISAVSFGAMPEEWAPLDVPVGRRVGKSSAPLTPKPRPENCYREEF